MKQFFLKYKYLKMSLVTLLVAGFLMASFFTAIMVSKPKEAQAICCKNCCYCTVQSVIHDQSQWIGSYLKLNFYFYYTLVLHQKTWFEWTYWLQNLMPLFVHLSNQLAAVGTMQITMIGMFFDAQEQLETQRDLQVLKARAHKDYHPSYGVCEFGTRVQSLAASERIGEVNALILSERSSDRYLGSSGTLQAFGAAFEGSHRAYDYATKYCNPFDNQNTLKEFCPSLVYSSSSSPSADDRGRMNKDIDYQRTLMDPWTLDMDLTSGGSTVTSTEEEVFALSENLYGYDAFPRPEPQKLQNGYGNNLTSLQQAYLDMRAVVAKTKVAENSYNALVAMKTEGTDGSANFLKAYLRELGMPSDEINDLIGDNPSYFAQMEILTKKAYQSQMFYTNLYDKPANVKRKGVAIQAVGLMQKFDLLKSYLRTEATLSILLELSVDQMQREIDDNIQSFTLAN